MIILLLLQRSECTRCSPPPPPDGSARALFLHFKLRNPFPSWTGKIAVSASGFQDHTVPSSLLHSSFWKWSLWNSLLALEMSLLHVSFWKLSTLAAYYIILFVNGIASYRFVLDSASRSPGPRHSLRARKNTPCPHPCPCKPRTCATMFSMDVHDYFAQHVKLMSARKFGIFYLF